LTYKGEREKNTDKFYTGWFSKITDARKWVQEIYWRHHVAIKNAEISTGIFQK
jgi:hypothetical protein